DHLIESAFAEYNFIIRSIPSHSDSDKVVIYKTVVEHQDETRGIDKRIRKIIEDLFIDGIKKPILILRALQWKKVKITILIQLNNYPVSYKKKKYGSHKVSGDELEECYKNNETISVEINQSFVIYYKILYNDDGHEDNEDIKAEAAKMF
ncbi:unnamed protein product, partial [Adineta steineri]